MFMGPCIVIIWYVIPTGCTSHKVFLFNLITVLHVSCVTNTHPQEHKATASTAVALCSWGWVVVTHETCRAVIRLNKKLCDLCIQLELHTRLYRSFATRVSQLKILQFWVIGIERNVCRCTFNRYSVITQFVKLAAGEQLRRLCTHRKL